MEQTFNIKANNNTYRIAKMNAIQLLAMQSQISFDSIDSTEKMYSLILEKIEVECSGKWLPVKEKDNQIFYPVGIENDIAAINELIHYFLYEYFMPLFTKSNESK